MDAKKLLDSFLGARSGQGGQNPLGGLGGGGLGDFAKSLGSPEGVRSQAGKAVDLARQNPIIAGGLLALLLGTRSGKGLAGSAIKLGGLAAIASMAYQAYQNHQRGQAAQTGTTSTGTAEPEFLPPPSGTEFDPARAPQGEEEFALSLVRAMVAAARADGHIDEEERRRIADRVALAGLDSESEQFLMDELARPVDLDALIASAQTEAQRVELYTASRLAIEPDSRAERGYLDHLAGRLRLPDALVDHIEATVSSAKL